MTEPFVSIVTPVYNGQKYLAECIESVITQTYQNWEYHITDNCSTDDSLKIAQSYAEKDQRIQVHSNKDFLAMVDNFNRSLEHISPASKYCKVVHADDLLLPACVTEMVSLAEKYPSIGIVSAYALDGVRIKCDGLPYPTSVFSGKEVARMSLMGKSPEDGGFLFVFGSPTSILMRAGLVRNRIPFYNRKYHQVVDQEACYYLLQLSDFGFVHQLLTYSRLHENSTTSSSQLLNKLIFEELELLKEYGPIYLTQDEYDKRLKQRMTLYYRFLADCLLAGKEKTVWTYHKQGLAKLNMPICWTKLFGVAVRKLAHRAIYTISHPKATFDGLKNK